VIRRTLSALCICTAAATCLAQDTSRPTRSTPLRAENVFFRAFFEDRGEEDAEKALASYREFLQRAPENRLAGHAARFAIRILRKLERTDEAQELERTHAAALAETVPAGINASFLGPDTDVARFISRFESESREIFKYRQRIVDLLELQPGEAVADIGAGTGFFTNLFARKVGATGRIYAVEIAPKFVEHLQDLATAMNLPQIEVVQCTSRSAELPENSIDMAFICDVYHHFEHAAATMQSIHRALRPGGQVVVIDFERIPGVSREWLLNHVRAGKEVFRDEVLAAGFELLREDDSGFLKENYILRFVKR